MLRSTINELRPTHCTHALSCAVLLVIHCHALSGWTVLTCSAQSRIVFVLPVLHSPSRPFTALHCPCPVLSFILFTIVHCHALSSSVMFILRRPALPYLILGPVLSCAVLPALSCTSLYYVMSFTVLHSCLVLHCPALSCTVLHCPAFSAPKLHCLVLQCTAYSVLSFAVLHCPALSCTALYMMSFFSCPALSCLVRHCPAFSAPNLHFQAVPVLSCTVLHILYCPSLFCTVLPCPALFCILCTILHCPIHPLGIISTTAEHICLGTGGWITQRVLNVL